MEKMEKVEKYVYHFPSGGRMEVEATPEMAAILRREDRIEASNNQRNRSRAGKFLSLEQLIEQGVQFPSRRDSIEHCHDVGLLRRLMQELSEEKCSFLQMMWEEGLTPTAMGRRLGISRPAVQRRLERIYHRLAKRLDKMGAME